ncbi:hypothetical protein HPB52_022817 [Rhipicephalus sanguineus]|uniref:PiggyBac transposable element-derived protein domain-containing protein n=1 Tax=Rhipicephalus sanguineus TaxID=34632 RepID=A0A9D4T646_RHISA|nr:hypothetical protein HPB52_022817 [Rhipicephalus sanguineus]
MGVVVLGYMLWVLATTENRRFIDGVLVFTYVHLGVGAAWFLTGMCGWIGSYKKGGLGMKLFLFLAVVMVAAEIGGIVALSILKIKMVDILKSGWIEVNEPTKNFIQDRAAIDLLFSLPDDEREGASVCQLPPLEDGNITDEEHVNENDFSEVVPDDVCGHVEVMQCSDEDVDSPSACSSPEPRRKKPAGRQFTAGKGRKASTKARKTNTPERSHTPAWGDRATFDKTLPGESPPLLLEAFPELANMSPSMLGYHSVTSEDSYWSTAEDLCVPIVATVMARNRFRQLKRFFHVVDNTQLKAGEKMGKIQPFYDEISKCFRQFRVFNESLSIDESMVPYYGHHSCKMFIRGKPIRFGYKIWMMCSTNGYPYAMEIYCGRNEKDDKTPLGIRVVSNMVSVLEAPEQHEVYFDNFFTSHGLLTKLADQGIRATGTVRDTRTGGCPLKSLKSIGKEERGSFHYKCDGAVYSCRGSDAAMTHIAFRRDVTMSLLQLKPKLTVRPGPRVHPRHEDRKTDGHYMISTTQGSESEAWLDCCGFSGPKEFATTNSHIDETCYRLVGETEDVSIKEIRRIKRVTAILLSVYLINAKKRELRENSFSSLTHRSYTTGY